jgi:hypothetical protein
VSFVASLMPEGSIPLPLWEGEGGGGSRRQARMNCRYGVLAGEPNSWRAAARRPLPFPPPAGGGEEEGAGRS